MLNLTQNGDIPCIYLFQNLWNWLIVLFHIIILLNISIQISSEKYNTKIKKRGALSGGGRFLEKIWYVLYMTIETYHMTIARGVYLFIAKFSLHLKRPMDCILNLKVKCRKCHAALLPQMGSV